MTAPVQEIPAKKVGREINEIFDRFLRTTTRSFKDGGLTYNFRVSQLNPYPEGVEGRRRGRSLFVNKFCRVSADEGFSLEMGRLVGDFVIRQSFKNIDDSIQCIGEEKMFFIDKVTNRSSLIMKSKHIAFCELDEYCPGAEQRVVGFYKSLLSANKAAGFSDIFVSSPEFRPSAVVDVADSSHFSGGRSGIVK